MMSEVSSIFGNKSNSSSPRAKRRRLNDDCQDDDTSMEAEHGSSPTDPASLQLLPLIKYEYTDSNEFIKIHSWGDNVAEAFEQCAMGMFALLTDVYKVDNLMAYKIEAKGYDVISLLHEFLNAWLFAFNVKPYFIGRKICITAFDSERYSISAVGYGEAADLRKHTPRAKVKAVSYSNLSVNQREHNAEIFAIVDCSQYDCEKINHI